MYNFLFNYILLGFINCSHKLHFRVGGILINPTHIHRYGFRFIDHVPVYQDSRITNVNFNSYAVLNHMTRQILPKIHGRMFSHLIMVRDSISEANQYSIIRSIQQGGSLSFKYSNNTRRKL